MAMLFGMLRELFRTMDFYLLLSIYSPRNIVRIVNSSTDCCLSLIGRDIVSLSWCRAPSVGQSTIDGGLREEN